MVSDSSQRLRYAPDEQPKRKHGWHKDEAGFVDQDGVPVGKCPKGLSMEEAERLLNEGIPFDPTGSGALPRAIYAIRGGVLYRAVPTVGVWYHGFPEHPRHFERLPLRFRRQVFE